jgi:probable HAF family extracellular repeat protein
MAATLAGGVLSSPAQTYTVTDLGAVFGETVSAGYALNAMGQAAGVSSSPSGDIATLFSGGQAINLGLLEPNDVSVATAINASAEVVGFEYFSSTPDNTGHAWIFSNGTLHDIHSPSLFPAGSSAEAINGLGVVVGEGLLTSSEFHAFVYSNGEMTDIGPPGAYQASAVAINDSGEIIGSSYPGGAFIFSNGKFTFLKPPSGTSVAANAISSTGGIAGTIYFNSGASPHAALYSNGVWTDLGGISGGVAVHGTGINAAGQIIATAYYPVQSYHPFMPGKHVAYIVRNGGLVDLNTLIPSNSGVTLTDAIAINDSGEILCDAKTSTSTKQAVLLKPK